MRVREGAKIPGLYLIPRPFSLLRKFQDREIPSFTLGRLLWKVTKKLVNASVLIEPGLSAEVL